VFCSTNILDMGREAQHVACYFRPCELQSWRSMFAAISDVRTGQCPGSNTARTRWEVLQIHGPVTLTAGSAPTHCIRTTCFGRCLARRRRRLEPRNSWIPTSKRPLSCDTTEPEAECWSPPAEQSLNFD
jgi:hypothetical protein